jgi:hypothetical protein
LEPGLGSSLSAVELMVMVLLGKLDVGRGLADREEGVVVDH